MYRPVFLTALAALATAVVSLPSSAQAPAPRVVLVQAGQLLDRPDRPARGASTIVIRDGKIAEARNLGDRDGVTLALRDAVRAGKVVDPNIVDAGSSISTTSGHMDAALGFRDDLREALDRHDNLCDGPDACRRAVRLQVARGVDLIKIAATGGVNSRIGAGLGQQMFEDEAAAIVQTARLYGKKSPCTRKAPMA